ncbi:MAG: hypothetical protein RLN72_11060 [Henriciella sp.]
MAYRHAEEFYSGPQPVGDAAGGPRSCNKISRSGETADRLSDDQQRLLAWVESQCGVTQLWLDQLVASGDPGDLVSLIHRQAAWLELVRDRLGGRV